MGQYNTETIYDVNDVSEIYQSAFITAQYYNGHFNIEDHPSSDSSLNLKSIPDYYDEMLESWLSEHYAGKNKIQNQTWRTPVTNHLISSFFYMIDKNEAESFSMDLDDWILENWPKINIRYVPEKYLSVWFNDEPEPTPNDIISLHDGYIYNFDLTEHLGLNDNINTQDDDYFGWTGECNLSMIAITYLYFNRVIKISDYAIDDDTFHQIEKSNEFMSFIKELMPSEDLSKISSAPNEYKAVISAMFHKFGSKSVEKLNEIKQWNTENHSTYCFPFNSSVIMITYADDEMDENDTEFYSRPDVDYLLGPGDEPPKHRVMPESLLDYPPHSDKLGYWALTMSIWGEKKYHDNESDREKIHELALHWTSEALQREKDSKISQFIKSKHNHPYELGGLRKTILMLIKYNNLLDALNLCSACIHYGLNDSDVKTSFPDLLEKINKKITEQEKSNSETKQGRKGKLSDDQILDLVSRYVQPNTDAKAKKELMSEFDITYSHMTYLVSKNKHRVK